MPNLTFNHVVLQKVNVTQRIFFRCDGKSGNDGSVVDEELDEIIPGLQTERRHGQIGL